MTIKNNRGTRLKRASLSEGVNWYSTSESRSLRANHFFTSSIQELAFCFIDVIENMVFYKRLFLAEYSSGENKQLLSQYPRSPSFERNYIKRNEMWSYISFGKVQQWFQNEFSVNKGSIKMMPHYTTPQVREKSKTCLIYRKMWRLDMPVMGQNTLCIYSNFPRLLLHD